ncbi:MAG: hypothetical protein ACC645_03230 [Pirellulales bacterium]
MAIAAGALSVQVTLAAGRGKLTITVVDADTGKPIAARMHLKGRGFRRVKPPGTIFWKDHFVVDGTMTLRLAKGQYTFEMERGPEYKTRGGHFQIDPFAEDSHVIEMHRFVDMSAHGWWSGDLHIHRKWKDLQALMRADDLHVGPVIAWWNAGGKMRKSTTVPSQPVLFDGNRIADPRGGEDERIGGALLYFRLDKPLDLEGANKYFPPSIHYLRQARQQEPLHVDAEKPFWWDLPVWLASGLVDTIGLANNHMWRNGALDNEAWGRPRDKVRFPSPLGNARWSQAIYYKVLECGLRIPPSAGSASGVLPNPVGYNRVYVHCGSELSTDSWWDHLRQGRVVVTNGPLMIPNVEGELPGHVFQAAQGESITLQPALQLWTRDKIPYLEVVKNGQVVHEVRLDDWTEKRGELPPLTFDRSGWFLIRAVTDNSTTYRFASTGPYYVEIGGERRVSRGAAQFFIDWIDQRTAEIDMADAEQQREVIGSYEQARVFFKGLANRANAE